jgi:predicted transcriptional regulator
MAVLRRKVFEPRPPHEYTPVAAARDARRIAETKTLQQQPLDTIGLATSIGINVELVPMESSTSGFLRKERDTWKIGVNSLHHPNRRRFTIAHELGHYFLHRGDGDFQDGILFRKEYQVNRREREANEFAAQLLMPTVEFRRQLSVHGYDVLAVANVFGVSGAAAEFRAQNVDNEIPID